MIQNLLYRRAFSSTTRGGQRERITSGAVLFYIATEIRKRCGFCDGYGACCWWACHGKLGDIEYRAILMSRSKCTIKPERSCTTHSYELVPYDCRPNQPRGTKCRWLRLIKKSKQSIRLLIIKVKKASISWRSRERWLRRAVLQQTNRRQRALRWKEIVMNGNLCLYSGNRITDSSNRIKDSSGHQKGFP
jgi:hypothetical protein